MDMQIIPLFTGALFDGLLASLVHVTGRFWKQRNKEQDV